MIVVILDNKGSLLISYQLKGKPIALIGGSTLNLPKLKLLIDCNQKILLFSDHPSEAVKQYLAEHTEVALHHLSMMPEHNPGLAISGWEEIDGSDERITNIPFNCPINFIDLRDSSDFFIPALLNRGELQIGIASNGASPTLVSKLRTELETMIPTSVTKLVTILSKLRAKLPKNKKYLSKRIMAKAVTDISLPFNDGTLDNYLSYVLDTPSKQYAIGIVGAGPGDPELLTVKATHWLANADVVLHDQLISQDILNRVRRDATIINVGKFSKHNRDKPSSASTSQDRINQLLYDYAQQGKIVCRLKAGDPFIFARGGEEIMYLLDRGINAEVVPGISAYQGAASSALVPVTHRLISQSLLIITGHEINGEFALDFDQLKYPKQTIAIYMAKYSVKKFVKAALSHGILAQTPVAIVFNATLPNQFITKCTLQDLPGAIQQCNDNGIDGSVLYLMGDTVNLLTAQPLEKTSFTSVLNALKQSS